jgi:hypothetical protein
MPKNTHKYLSEIPSILVVIGLLRSFLNHTGSYILLIMTTYSGIANDQAVIDIPEKVFSGRAFVTGRNWF